jgi:hypothetical protein
MLALPAVGDELASAYTLIHPTQRAFAEAFANCGDFSAGGALTPPLPRGATLLRGQFG